MTFFQVFCVIIVGAEPDKSQGSKCAQWTSRGVGVEHRKESGGLWRKEGSTPLMLPAALIFILCCFWYTGV